MAIWKILRLQSDYVCTAKSVAELYYAFIANDLCSLVRVLVFLQAQYYSYGICRRAAGCLLFLCEVLDLAQSLVYLAEAQG